MRICVLVTCFFLATVAWGQPDLPDSILHRLKGVARDSTYVSRLNVIATSYLRTNPVLSRKIANHASDVAQQIEFPRGYARSLTVIGNSYWYQGIYEFAQNYYMLAARYYKDSKDEAGLGRVYNNIGEVNKGLGDFNQALNYFLRSVRLRPGDSTLALTYNNIGELYLLQGNLGEAQNYVDTAVQLADRYKDTRSSIYNLWLTGRIKLAKNEASAAVPFLEKAVEGWRRLNEMRTLTQTYHELADTYRGIGDLEKASYYLDLAEETEKHFHVPELRAQTYLFRAKLDSSRGDFSAAYRNLRRHNSLRDSLYNATKAEQIARVQAVYETERMDRENEQLRSGTRLREEQLRARENMLAAISAGLVVIALFTMVLLRQRYRILRNNRVLQEKNDEINNQKHSIELQSIALMRLNDELQQLNKTLERRIEERSQQLILKNQKLAEYSFVNGHKLRAPVASILGLIQLMTQVDPEERLVILQHLKTCANQLDAVIQEISRNLEVDD